MEHTASRPASVLRALVVDSPGSLGARTRARRLSLFHRQFPDIADMRVLDLGGTVEYWLRAPVRPKQVTVVNLFEPGESVEPWLVPVTGDACAAVETLEKAGIQPSFDLVFSNSLLEHVGGHSKRVDLAAQVHLLADRHWVQTPYRYFPVEPHWLFPLMQFLPVNARTTIAHSWPLAHSRPASRTGAQSAVMWTELVGIAQMRSYFPQSLIVREKFAGLTKSLVAVAGGQVMTS
jgi:hypothetical protein